MNVLEETIKLENVKETQTETFIGNLVITQVKQDGKSVTITIPTAEELPFPPAIQTCILNPETNKVEISCIIYVDTKTTITENTLTVSVRPNLLYTTAFFYEYISPSKLSTEFFMYQLKFNCNASSIGQKSEIITFLKNLDPETSRGTVTTVKRPTGITPPSL